MSDVRGTPYTWEAYFVYDVQRQRRKDIELAGGKASVAGSRMDISTGVEASTLLAGPTTGSFPTV